MKSERGAALVNTAAGASPLWDSSRSYVRAIIRDLQVECRVGLHPWEQQPERPSRLVLNVELFAHTTNNTRHQDQDSILNYDYIRDAIRQWPGRPHTPLLETLLEELIHICFNNPHVEACRVSIIKADVFNEAAAAGVEMYRVRAEQPLDALPMRDR
jgi:7,8-dihydroneopterin aldolase/epimerase/oxygenase